MKQLRLIVSTFAFLVALATIAGPALAAEAPEFTRPAALAAIDDAFSRGEISEAEAYLYKLAWVKNSAILPERFAIQDHTPVKSATQLLLEIEEKMSTFPPEIQGYIEMLRSRPVCQTYIDTEHFRIHYDTTGTHMIRGWPNTSYRDEVMISAEHCYQVFHVDNLWQVPPGDGGNGGGWNLIDCYVRSLPSGLLGYAQTESTVPNDGWPNSRTGFFVIDNTYSGNYLNQMRATLAHEYMHVTQFGYTVSNNWWMENVAMWAEELAYDHINVYIPYISTYMWNPFKRLYTYDGSFEYGACVWPIYMTDRHGDIDMIRRIYHTSGTTPIHTSFDQVLSDVGYDFATGLAEWHVWNFYTHYRDDGQHYEEGGNWPYYMMFDRQFGSYPQYNQQPSSHRRPEGTAASVQRLMRNPYSADNILTITYDGPSCTQQVVFITKVDGQDVFHEFYMDLSGGYGVLEVTGWDVMEFGHMISTFPLACTFQPQNYTFHLETSVGDPGSVDDSPLYTRVVDLSQNMPNPFAGNTQISYALPSPAPVDIAIYDAGGRQVRSLVSSAGQRAGNHVVHWDGRDDLGREVAPGTYFYRLDAGGELLTRKMILAR